MALIHILLDIIAPIFVLIGMGFFFEKNPILTCRS
jgi:hypothetical protein